MLRGWDLPTIFVTADFDARTVVRAMRQGADDYLTKPSDPEELIRAVERAVLCSLATRKAALEREQLFRRAAPLTKRERIIVSLIVTGLLNKQIAQRLNLALVTIKAHRGRAMQKLGARKAAELPRIASITGITPG